MAEHLSPIQLVGYESRTLDPEELLAVDRHLASCDVCHDRLARMSPKTSDRSYDLSIQEPFHLNYDEHLVPYVDGTANEIDREIVESHIALCSQCEEDVRDLQEFRQQPGLPSLPTDRDVRVSRRTQWMGQWQWPLWNPQLTAALVLAIFILGITAAFLLWTRNRSQPAHKAGSALPPGVDKQIGTESTSPGPSPEQLVIQPSPDGRDNPGPPKSLVALNDGGQQITLDEGGHSTGLEALPPELRTTVENVLATRRFRPSPALGSFSDSTARQRGRHEQPDTIVPLTPVGIVIQSDRPTFRWRALEGASDYVVTVHDSKLRTIESSGPLAGTEWSIQKPLERGITYSWQIRAVKDGKTVISAKPPAPEARFRVLDQKAFAAIENAKRVQGNSHLMMGVLYWKHGLVDAAEREIEALVRANPDSNVAAELLRSLRSLRRR